MKFDELKTIEAAHQAHPEAETDVEAVDLYCQDVYQQIQDSMHEVDDYPAEDVAYLGHLKALLATLNQREYKKHAGNIGVVSERTLEDLSLEELRELCKKNNLEGYSDLNKKQLFQFVVHNIPATFP